MVLFAIVAALACLTTAIALTSAAGRYFAGLSGGKVGYQWVVAAICIFSAVISGVGVEQLVKLASPILSIVYPPVLALVLLRFFGRGEQRWFYRLPAAAAMVVGLLETVGAQSVALLPLARLGFAWVTPVAVTAVLGYYMDAKKLSL